MHARAARSAVAALSFACPLAAAQSTHTLAVFPDTQNFSEAEPVIYQAMCQWLVDNRETLNLKFLSHVGDIVNRDTLGQWSIARAAHDRLSAVNIPQGLAIGNHDFQSFDAPPLLGRNYLDHFGPEALYDFADAAKGTWSDQTWWGGSSPTGLSSYQIVDFGPLPMLFLNVEFELRETEVDWAEDVVAAHPDRLVVVTTHFYPYDLKLMRGRVTEAVNELLGPLWGDFMPGTPDLYERIVTRFPNVIMVLSGHQDSERRTVTTNGAGLPVFEMIQDFQRSEPRGGNGWMRLYEFDPMAAEIRARTFSPVVDGGRDRTLDDQIQAIITALSIDPELVDEVLGPALESLPPEIGPFLIAILSQKGAASAVFEALRTRDPELISALALFGGFDPQTLTDVLDVFPFDDLNRGVISLLDRDGGVIAPLLLDGDLAGLASYFAEDTDRVIEGFYADGQSEAAFTLSDIDWNAYLGQPACAGAVNRSCVMADLAAPCGRLDIADVIEFLQRFGAEDPITDFAAPSGQFDIGDVVSFLQSFAAGCP